MARRLSNETPVNDHRLRQSNSAIVTKLRLNGVRQSARSRPCNCSQSQRNCNRSRRISEDRMPAAPLVSVEVNCDSRVVISVKGGKRKWAKKRTTVGTLQMNQNQRAGSPL